MSGDNTAIQWTHRPGTKGETWNPVTGCTKVSPGCAHCYIVRTPPFRMAGRRFVRGATGLELYPERIEQPLHWKTPRTVFVNSLSDLFHEDIPDEFLDRIFAVMALTPQHTYQILTKRPERMRTYIEEDARVAYWHDGTPTPKPVSTATKVLWKAQQLCDEGFDYTRTVGDYPSGDSFDWPLKNVWLGVTAENQHFADERIPILLDTPAAMRFVSLEPLLGRISLCPCGRGAVGSYEGPIRECWLHGEVPLNWVITGGESGGPENRRLVERCCRMGSPFGPAQRLPGLGYDPKDTICERYNRGECDVKDWQLKPEALAWVRALRDQCAGAGVSFFWKQAGGPTAKSGGRLLDGREWNEWPA